MIRVVHEGRPDRAERLASTLRDRDAVATVTSTTDLSRDEFDADDRVVALGERALRAVALTDHDVPVCPVDSDTIPAAQSYDDLDRLVEMVLTPDPDVVEHPILSVSGADGERGRAILDTALVTSEPARISEYAVTTDGRSVDRFRADGVVVATPLGSGGYARSVGGPRLGPETGLAVVPISPFETRRDCWVIDGPVGLSVERDDSEVALVVDDERVGSVTTGDGLVVDVAGRFPVQRYDGL